MDDDPDAHLYIRVLAALRRGLERDLLSVDALPDDIATVPVWFLRKDPD